MSTQSNQVACDQRRGRRGDRFRNGTARRAQAALLTCVLLAASLAACAPTRLAGPIDVGNMAYPEPLPQGNLLTTTTGSGRQPSDTGNMAYPEPLAQGNIGVTRLSGRQQRDTGNMAYPAANPVGSIVTTPAR